MTSGERFGLLLRGCQSRRGSVKRHLAARGMPRAYRLESLNTNALQTARVAPHGLHLAISLVRTVTSIAEMAPAVAVAVADNIRKTVFIFAQKNVQCRVLEIIEAFFPTDMGNQCCSLTPRTGAHGHESRESSPPPSPQPEQHTSTQGGAHSHPQFAGLPRATLTHAGLPSDTRSAGDDETLGDSSGSVGPSVPKLRLRIPKRETDLVLAYDRTPPDDESILSFLRSTNDLGSLPDSLNKTGMQSLLLSGSEGISSIKQVQRIMQTAGTTVLYFVDLREESHAIASGYPVTLRGQRDWANVGLSRDEVLQNEEELISQLGQQDEVTLYKSLDLRKGAAQPRSVTLRRPDVVSERALVEEAGAQYFRLTVTDHCRPRRADVDRFIELVKNMPEGAGLHVHCLGGRGRTTTFMTLYDMLHNAHRVSAEDIIERQARFSYDYQMSAINPNKPYKLDFQEDRLKFLHMFHEYAKSNPGGKGVLWSEWRRQAIAP